ncbi:MAG TPA: helix-turn-helix domain-containing protein [Acetobacteraceae bacterium]|nr:helix-turn-helix domain-containing protein [Acetobacteraceae bacterium]
MNGSSADLEWAVKVSGKKVAENRAALVETARRLLQERGFAGAGVADISQEAGLTQGALYGQFKSKNALAAAAACKAFADAAASWRELRDAAPEPLPAFLDAYLCESHLTDAGSGCLLAACVSDVARQDESIGAAFAEGFRNAVERIQAALPAGMPEEEARRRALALASALVGSVAMARAVDKTDPGLSREIIAAARRELEQLAVR